jgi:hypothetical protein
MVVNSLRLNLILLVWFCPCQCEGRINFTASISKIWSSSIVSPPVGLSIDNIGHSIYGGLYNQMLFGESFEERPNSSQEYVPSIDSNWAHPSAWSSFLFPSNPWLPYGDGVSFTTVQPAHGRQSAVLTCEGAAVCPWCVAVGNRV